MTQDEFRRWFERSFERLVQAVFRCVQTSSGGRYEDAEDGIQNVLVTMFRHWDRYQGRLVVDAAGTPRMRRQDGSPGATLFSYLVRAACHAGRRLGRNIISGIEDEAIQMRVSPSEPLIQEEHAAAFRQCWARLAPEQQQAIRGKLRDEEQEERNETARGRERLRRHRGLNALRECLAARGLQSTDLLDIHGTMRDIICETPAPGATSDHKGI